MVRDTSYYSYMQIKENGLLGQREQEVYDALRRIGSPATDMEIMAFLGYQVPNKVRPRRKGLYDKHLVIEAGKRQCSITGKWVNTWKPTEGAVLPIKRMGVIV